MGKGTLCYPSEKFGVWLRDSEDGTEVWWSVGKGKDECAGRVRGLFTFSASLSRLSVCDALRHLVDLSHRDDQDYFKVKPKNRGLAGNQIFFFCKKCCKGH